MSFNPFIVLYGALYHLHYVGTSNKDYE